VLLARTPVVLTLCSWTASSALVIVGLCLPWRAAQAVRDAQPGLHLHPDGLLLWRGRPWSGQLLPGRRVRLVPQPSVPWEQVLRRVHELQEKGFAIEIQLPPA